MVANCNANTSGGRKLKILITPPLLTKIFLADRSPWTSWKEKKKRNDINLCEQRKTFKVKNDYQKDTFDSDQNNEEWGPGESDTHMAYDKQEGG